MAEPVIERIADQYARTLRSVTEASGYTLTLEQVYRAFRNQNIAVDLPYACVLTEGEDGEEADPLLHWKCLARFSVYVFILADGADPDLADTLTNRAVSDVKRAILSEPALQGGQVAGTLVDRTLYEGFDRALFGDGTSWVHGAEVRFLTTYVHHETDPRRGSGE